MLAAPLPHDEAERLAALQESGVLSGEPHPKLREIAQAAAREAGTPTGFVSFIGADRTWIRASAGGQLDDVERGLAFCAWAVYGAEVLWVEDALNDPRFFDHPLVTGEPAIRHYAGAPVTTPDGYVLGTVCVIDGRPRPFDPELTPKLIQLAAEVSKLLYGAEAASGRRGRSGA